MRLKEEVRLFLNANKALDYFCLHLSLLPLLIKKEKKYGGRGTL